MENERRSWTETGNPGDRGEDGNLTAVKFEVEDYGANDHYQRTVATFKENDTCGSDYYQLIKQEQVSFIPLEDPRLTLSKRHYGRLEVLSGKQTNHLIKE